MNFVPTRKFSNQRSHETQTEWRASLPAWLKGAWLAFIHCKCGRLTSVVFLAKQEHQEDEVGRD